MIPVKISQIGNHFSGAVISQFPKYDKSTSNFKPSFLFPCLSNFFICSSLKLSFLPCEKIQSNTNRYYTPFKMTNSNKSARGVSPSRVRIQRGRSVTKLMDLVGEDVKALGDTKTRRYSVTFMDISDPGLKKKTSTEKRRSKRSKSLTRVAGNGDDENKPRANELDEQHQGGADRRADRRAHRGRDRITATRGNVLGVPPREEMITRRNSPPNLTSFMGSIDEKRRDDAPSHSSSTAATLAADAAAAAKANSVSRRRRSVSASRRRGSRTEVLSASFPAATSAASAPRSRRSSGRDSGRLSRSIASLKEDKNAKEGKTRRSSLKEDKKIKKEKKVKKEKKQDNKKDKKQDKKKSKSTLRKTKSTESRKSEKTTVRKTLSLPNRARKVEEDEFTVSCISVDDAYYTSSEEEEEESDDDFSSSDSESESDDDSDIDESGRDVLSKELNVGVHRTTRVLQRAAYSKALLLKANSERFSYKPESLCVGTTSNGKGSVGPMARDRDLRQNLLATSRAISFRNVADSVQLGPPLVVNACGMSICSGLTDAFPLSDESRRSSTSQTSDTTGSDHSSFRRDERDKKLKKERSMRMKDGSDKDASRRDVISRSRSKLMKEASRSRRSSRRLASAD